MDLRMTANVVCNVVLMYLHNHHVVHAAASAPGHAKASPTVKGPLQFLPGRPIVAVPSECRAYRSAVPVVEEDIADQRSSKLAVGSSFASTLRPFDIVVPAETTMPSVEGECDFMVAADAATASKATATNPVIVRCLVMRTSYSGPNAP
jgi:hypothetical protein